MASHTCFICCNPKKAQIFKILTPHEETKLKCNICRNILRECETKSLIKIKYPFQDANSVPFHLVVKPAIGTFSRNFSNKSVLHIGITSSDGLVWSYDFNGIVIDKTSWDQSIILNIFGSFKESVRSLIYKEWDNKLFELLKINQFSKTSYDSYLNNCFDFVLKFLEIQSSCIPTTLNDDKQLIQLKLDIKNKEDFCKHNVSHQVEDAVKFLSLLRKLENNECIFDINTL